MRRRGWATLRRCPARGSTPHPCVHETGIRLIVPRAAHGVRRRLRGNAGARAGAGPEVPPLGRGTDGSASVAATARTMKAVFAWSASRMAACTCSTVSFGKSSRVRCCTGVSVNCAWSRARQSRLACVFSASESGCTLFLRTVINWLRCASVNGGLGEAARACRGGRTRQLAPTRRSCSVCCRNVLRDSRGGEAWGGVSWGIGVTFLAAGRHRGARVARPGDGAAR